MMGNSPRDLVFSFDTKGVYPTEIAAQIRELLSDETTRRQFIADLKAILSRKAHSLPQGVTEYLHTLLTRENSFRSQWMNAIPLKASLYNRLSSLKLIPRIPKLGSMLWGGDQKIINMASTFQRKRRFWQGKMRFEDVLTHCGVDVLALQGLFISPVCVPASLAGCYKQGETVSAYLVGLDIIPSPSGNYVLEANLSPAVRANRNQFYDQEPIVSAIVAMAKNQKASNLVLDWAWLMPVNPWFLEQIEAACADEGLKLIVVLDPRLKSKTRIAPHIHFSVPQHLSGKSLHVKTRQTFVGQDYALNDKDVVNQVLQIAKEQQPDATFSVAEMTVFPKDAWLTTENPGLPNLVYKYSEENRGQGVYLMKARDCEHALQIARDIDARTGHAGGLFQRFTCSHILPGNLFYDVRTFALITPDEAIFAGCLRKQSCNPLPEKLDYGLVQDNTPFIMNPHVGNEYSRCSDEETAVIEQATMELSAVLTRFLNEGFTVIPESRTR